ncbi:MAG: HD domain-containing protein [Armatimonadetes bacterium]|nr:HD domain-containing protein [Armatimonadota bacterium]
MATHRRQRRPLVFVRDLVPGTAVDSCFLLRGATLGGGNGPKLRARIWDRTGDAQLIAWQWDSAAPLVDGAYHVAGSVNVYQGNVQIAADRIEACPPDTDLQELLPTAPRSVAGMWGELERLCATCGHPDLHALLHLCLNDAALCEQWRRAPAAVLHHHAYAGGLLEHTLGVINVALSLAEHFPAADRDLLLAGAVLHDIGKTEAYTTTGLPDMTDRGRLLGHVYPGVRLVDGLIEQLPGFPQELRDRLLHVIGSHHGEREFGVLEVPRTPEAILLHYADNLDAKMKAVTAACEDSRGRAWTGPVRSLGGERIYLGTENNGVLFAPREPLEDILNQGLFAFDAPDPDPFDEDGFGANGR